MTKIIFSTAHGNYRLNVEKADSTLIDVCRQNSIPHNSISIYGRKAGSDLRLLTGMYKNLDCFSDFDELVLQSDRNIKHTSAMLKEVRVQASESDVAEYSFPEPGKDYFKHIGFSEDEARQYVFEKVDHFISNHTALPNDRPIVLGISGGGDSNTFLDAFVRSDKIDKDQLKCVMILGIPDWDLGANRAKLICDAYGVEITYITKEEISKLLGKKSSNYSQDFEEVFDEDVETIGTLAIRLALFDVAKKINAQAVCTGLNLEDILAECFLQTMQGKLPRPFPIRELGESEIWYPLYSIPKKILDACNPKLSLENYSDRYPSYLRSRAIAYYLAQMQHCVMPGSEFDILRGFQELSSLNCEYELESDEVNFSVSGDLSDELLSKWQRFLSM